MKKLVAILLVLIIVLVLIIIIVGYPVIYVISSSFSSAIAIQAGRVLLWPVKFTLDGYKFVLQYRQVWIGYRNTLFYTAAGVVLSLFFKIVVAYPISRPRFHAKGLYTKLLIVTMLVNAGLIPTFLIKVGLGMFDTVWAVLLTGLIGAAAKMRPSKSVMDMELSSLKKKFKDKKFAAGCSRDVIKLGAERLGWELGELLEKTLEAMKSCESSVEKEMEGIEE